MSITISKICICICALLLVVSVSAQAVESAPKFKEPITSTQPLPTWMLTSGHTIGQDMQSWGEQAGWKVVWNVPQDWSVPASVVFEGEFPDVVAEVIKTLGSNGALVHAQIFEGNRIIIITGAGTAG